MQKTFPLLPREGSKSPPNFSPNPPLRSAPKLTSTSRLLSSLFKIPSSPRRRRHPSPPLPPLPEPSRTFFLEGGAARTAGPKAASGV
uniref:Uncharacterized protein n=1 Tax=Leersia perrieri TaxID=77586 RepID=A0A0D9Y1L1_9ORYZ